MRSLGPGRPEPLGVSLVEGGANVAVYSAHASAIELCLFDATGASELERIRLPARTGDVHHGFVAGIAAGTRYGLRAQGPYAPHEGHRFNAAKLLVDPYATALDRPFAFVAALCGTGERDHARDDTDSAPFVPKAIVVPPVPSARPLRPRVPWSDTIVYELHVRGFTRTKADIPESLRGTCAGLAHPASIAHLRQIGVTTVELMPIAAAIDERHLGRLGLRNYWGYNPIALFVPEPRLAPGGIAELRDCVDALHDAGIEVLLDIVLNHSGEGDELGPTVSLRGLDNATYYRTLAGDASRYADDTGCGNTLALDRPPVLRLALDVLRHYARTAGVDGFRFDLATTLGRRDGGFDPAAPLLAAIAQDPELRELKLIAEPWDVGPGAHRLGAFPAAWGEWNDRYRDAVRRFWRGDAGTAGELATRLAGSADVFAPRSRPLSRSVNFVTAHDGFTALDLVSYAGKHNAANGEDNRDGSDLNHSWNHGVEGPTADPAVCAARTRDVRNLLATLLLSRGTPMLAMGDELGRTQQGNNNAYAHDSELTWIDWKGADASLIAFVAALASLRKSHRALRLERPLTGRAVDASGIPDVEWRRADGADMTAADWSDPERRLLIAVLYAEASAAEPTPAGIAGGPKGKLIPRAAEAYRVVIACNAATNPIEVRWPEPRVGYAWRRRLDTALPEAVAGTDVDDSRHLGGIAGRSVVVLVEAPLGGREARANGIEDKVLDRLAGLAGIASEWHDVEGRRHVVGADTKRALLAAMNLGVASTDDARARLAELTATAERQASVSDVGQARCHLPSAIATGARRFGLAAHLYALRRNGDQGIGDFTTLSRMASATARAGGSVVAINPLHALFAADRDRASPYHPSDRRFLDPIYIDVDAVPDIGATDDSRTHSATVRERIAKASRATMVDYPTVWAAKRLLLQGCYDAFAKRARTDMLVGEFERFITDGGARLRTFALFEAIAAAHPGMAWQRWPAELRRPDAAGIDRFALEHADAIRFALYLQWLADRQLGAAARQAASDGLAFGFLRDLAIGAAPDGAETWASPVTIARGVSIGAPPDTFSPAGQNWSLPPPVPHAIVATEAADFRNLLAANMRHAGGLRIDHVMGLQRLFWIPDGATAAEGAYVRYPFELLLGVLAQESERARCMVVGEDLGTVPEGLRDRLAAADVLSYRVLWFERHGAEFMPPSHYPFKAVACVSTHDLPTAAGWWAGADIGERHALGLLDDSQANAARDERRIARGALARACVREGVAPAGTIDGDAPYEPAHTAAIHRYAGATNAALVLLQADDLAGETIAANLPGTDRERPNWRRKLRVDADDLWSTPLGAQARADFAVIRGAPSSAAPSDGLGRQTTANRPRDLIGPTD